MLSERSQTQEDKSSTTRLVGGPRSGRTHRDRKEDGGGGQELVFHGDRGSVWEDEKVLETGTHGVHVLSATLCLTMAKTAYFTTFRKGSEGNFYTVCI